MAPECPPRLTVYPAWSAWGVMSRQLYDRTWCRQAETRLERGSATIAAVVLS